MNKPALPFLCQYGLHKRHDPEQRNGEQTIEWIKRLPEQGDAKRIMKHVRMPDGGVNGRLTDGCIDPPEVPDVHESITVIREKVGGEITYQRIGQQAEKEEIE